MRKGFIILIAFVLLFTLTGFPLAEEESGNIEKPAKSGEGHKGDKGLCFSVSGLSSVGIGQYEGGIGGKYWVSNKLALISSIGIRISKGTSTNHDPAYTDNKYTTTSISLFTGLEDHVFIANMISPFWGGGVRYGASSSTSYPSRRKNDQYPYDVKETKAHVTTLGVRGFCGMEVFITRWASLSGEYQIDYSYAKNTTRQILVGGQGVKQPEELEATVTTLGMGTSVLVATFYLW